MNKEKKPDTKIVARLINEIERMLKEQFESVHNETGIIINEVELKIERDSFDYLGYQVKLKMVSDDYLPIEREEDHE